MNVFTVILILNLLFILLKKNEDISILIHRIEKCDVVEICYVNIICKLQFEIFNVDLPDVYLPPVNNPEIVYENYTLSNPMISKKIKLKIFDNKFLLSLDEENTTETSTLLVNKRDEKIANLLNYANMDFSFSYIDLNESFEFIDIKIGSGTYGSVCLCEEKKTNIQYATKILKESINEVSLQSLRELKILQSLRYPSIVKFIGFSSKDFNNNDHPTIIT